MRLLDRYLLRELLWPFFYCLGFLLVFWVGFDLFSELDDFHRKQLSSTDIRDYYFLKAPEILILLLPIVLLLAVLYSLNHHARHQEITAMRVAGISLWRLSATYFGAASLLALSLFWMNEDLVGRNSAAIEKLLRKHETSSLSEESLYRNLVFRNDRDRRLWHADLYHRQKFEMKNPVVLWHFPDGSRRELRAANAVYTNQVWEFTELIDHSYTGPEDAIGAISQTNLLRFDFSETPGLIESEIKIGAMTNFKKAKKTHLTIRDILSYRRLHPELAPGTRAMLETKLHARLALPFTCVIVVLIALPFAAASGRRNVFVGVASSIFICFSFFVLRELSQALGIRGTFPGWLAAWLPNLVFGGAGWFLTQRVR